MGSTLLLIERTTIDPLHLWVISDAAYAESVCATEELKFYKDNVDPTDMTSLKKTTTEHDPLLKFKSADDTKLVDFVPGDSSKQFSINANLDPK